MIAAFAAVLLPYIAAQAADTGMQRSFLYYKPLPEYFGGGRHGLGWMVLALAAVALAGRGTGLVREQRGDPRWALVAGASIVGLVAAGRSLDWSLRSIVELPFRVPNLHTQLAAFVPGLDSIRGIDRLGAAVQVVTVALAGIGAAALLELASASARLRAAAATGLVVAAFLVATRPFGLPDPSAWGLFEITPEPESVEFIDRMKNPAKPGAIFEIPFDRKKSPYTPFISPERVFATLQHRRRTSACFGSYDPPRRADLARIAGELPAASAVEQVRQLGFSSLVVHGGNPRPIWDYALAKLRRSGGPRLELVYSSEKGRIYDIVVPGQSRREPES